MLQIDEETTSAEKQLANNMAAPILITKRQRESSFAATPVAIKMVNRQRKTFPHQFGNKVLS